MRWTCVLFGCGVLALTLSAQDQPPPSKLAKRYGLDANAMLYPQGTPQEALKSLLKTIAGKRVDYLVAHLADPKFVDSRIDDYKVLYTQGNEEARKFVSFDRLVRETTDHFADDPLLVKELRQFAADAEWETNEDRAVGVVKTISARKVYMRRVDDRWFLENRQQ